MLNQQLFCQMMKKRKEIPEKMKKLKKPPLGGGGLQIILASLWIFYFSPLFRY